MIRSGETASLQPRSVIPRRAAALLLLCSTVGACRDDGGTRSDGGPLAGDASCNAVTCSGCCAGDECLSGESPEACGSGGLTCVRCPAGNACGASGHCVTDPAQCQPKDCAGCCLGDRCLPGDTHEACGAAGAPCTRCGSSQSCRDGTCRCTPETCPGCCADDICKTGEVAAACGRNGEPCRICGATEQCTGGECLPGSPCGDCPGCCDGPVCRPGDKPALCGRGGNPCRPCQPGELCGEGVCNDPTQCGPESCGECCADSVCLPGTAVDACGTAGDLCHVCGKSHVCDTGTCRVEAKSQWYLTVVSAAIDETLGTWDMLINTAPDPYVEVAVGTVFAESSGVQDDTYRPRWDEVIGVITAGDALAQQLQVEVRDSDAIGSETIGRCQVPVDDLAFASGVVIIDHCPHPDSGEQFVEYLELRLAAK